MYFYWKFEIFKVFFFFNRKQCFLEIPSLLRHLNFLLLTLYVYVTCIYLNVCQCNFHFAVINELPSCRSVAPAAYTRGVGQKHIFLFLIFMSRSLKLTTIQDETLNNFIIMNMFNWFLRKKTWSMYFVFASITDWEDN